VLFPALTHLTAMTSIDLGYTRLESAGASHLCSALTHLTAMTSLDLRDNFLTADDGARICGAAAAAGMTRLKALYLGGNNCSASDVVGCETWRQLNLPQPPHEIVRKCNTGSNCGFLVSYLLSIDKVSCYAIRIFVVGESTVQLPLPPLPLLVLPPSRYVFHFILAFAFRAHAEHVTDDLFSLTRCCRRARRHWFGRSCLHHANALP
jgi:hypothetical protein